MSGVLALIPARSGSKGVPHKNIRPIAGKPLIAWSIEQALASDRVDRVVVSTDSEEYAAIARAHGAEVPFMRPPEIAGDLSTDLEVFLHALQWLEEHEQWRPEVCAHLRPTHPIRNPDDINAVVELISADPQLDSVRSIALAPETPFKMWLRSDEGRLTPVVEHPELREAHSMPRQALPTVWLQNAAIDAIRASVILERRSMVGSSIGGYVMNHSFDIDTEEQFRRAEAWLRGAE